MLVKQIEETIDNGEKRYLVKMEYDADFLDKMKTSIAWPNRKWDPDNKAWSFNERGLAQFRNMPGIVFYEDALAEVIDTSEFSLPEPFIGIDESVNYSKFDRPETKFAPPLSLWNFQKQGISRIIHEKSHGLWFEMGLGKTYTTICAAKELIDRGEIEQCLVISTVQIALDSWIDTLTRMGYSFEILDGPGKFRPSRFFQMKSDFVLTLDTTASEERYPLYETEEALKSAGKKNLKIPRKKRSFVELANEKKKLMLVVDELHKLSNTQSKTFKSLLKIRKAHDYAIGLTGTVIKSTPEKCLLPLRFIRPNVFSNKGAFEDAFTIKEMTRFGLKIAGYRNLDVLKSILHRAGMPALKKDHLKDLPPLLPEINVVCDTDQVSLDLVDKIRNEDCMKLSRGSEFLELKDVFIRTHQALVCPSAFINGAKATNRLQAVADCLESLDGKTVIFTTLKKAILELHAYLTSLGIGCTCCSGSQSKEEIDRRVNKFISDENCSVMIATIQKMGTGFDKLKIAQNAIIYDHYTNAADLRQAIDRLHRSGQKNQVTVINILQDNCISEYLYEKIQSQKGLMENIEDANKLGIESALDMRHIFDLISDSSKFLRRRK